MLEYAEAYARPESTTGDVVALVGFDYRSHDVIRDLHTVQHDYQDVILNTSHTHQSEWCLCSVAGRANGYANSSTASVTSTPAGG